MTIKTTPEVTLLDELQKLHTQLGRQLEGSGSEEALLGVLKKCTELVGQYIQVPEYNTPGETVRPSLVDVYSRLARVLGRNTPEAVRADTRAMLARLGDRIVHRSGQGKRAETTPSEHIEQVIVPLVDKDMVDATFVQSI